MNCLPSSKIISGKSKNKYSLSATQKYEQRIKETKVNKEFHLCGIKSPKPEQKNEISYVDEWICKRKEIDKWRHSVLRALQIETNSTSSITDTDSHQRPDSSTLTTSSTLRSASEAVKTKFYPNNEMLTPTTEQKCCQFQKSPSIPLFQSNSKTPMDGNVTNNETLFYDFYARHSIDSKMSMVDDDDVFVPSNSPSTSRFVSNTQSTISSNQFISPLFKDCIHSNFYHKNYQAGENNHRTFLSQPINQHITLVSSNYGEKQRLPMKGSNNQKYQYQDTNLESSFIKHDNSMYYENPNSKMKSMNPERQPQSPKKTLHKNETNFKLILRPSNSSFNNGPAPFQRTRSLNIKRCPQNIDQSSNRPIPISNYEKDVHSRSNFPSFKYIFPKNNNGNVEKNLSNHNQLMYQSKYIVLKPTFSQEDICCKPEPSRLQNYPILKISSYNNLQFPTHEIPKVSIDEPLTMKFVFGSEPSLSRKF